MTNALNPAATASNIPPRILVIGGGYVGMFTAQRILKHLKRGEATYTRVCANCHGEIEAGLIPCPPVGSKLAA